MRLEGVAPFGPPAFILAARGNMAVLLLPRDDRVLKGERAEDMLGALTGVALAPADLQAILTGCVTADPKPTSGRLHENGWASIDLEGGARVFLQRQNNAGRCARRVARDGRSSIRRGRDVSRRRCACAPIGPAPTSISRPRCPRWNPTSTSNRRPSR